jgi:WD40 repeat protein
VGEKIGEENMKALRSAKSLLVLVTVLAGAGFVADALGIHLMPPITTVHGKPTLKLSKKFSLDLPNGTTGVAWSPDGSTLGVSSLYSMKLNAYDGSGHQLSEFESNGNNGAYLNAFAFINGASQVLFPVENAAKKGSALDIRDVVTGHITNTLAANYMADNFAVSPDQKRFAIANGAHGSSVIYSTEDGKDWHESAVTKAIPNGKIWFRNISLCFFPDGKLLAIGQSEGHFAVADSTTGEIIKEFHAYDAPGIDDNVAGIAVSPKGDLLLTGLSGVAISPPLATPAAWAWNRSDHAVVSIWRISDGKEIAHLPNKNKATRQAVWDPLNRFVAFVDNDSLVVWQPEIPGENFIRIKYPSLASSLAITSDGKSLAVAAGNNVTVYNIEDNFQKSS